jgi:selenocysteine-specific elongation factor
VIAANEGPRPQTFEHLAILSFLNARRTLVVLTKADTVDAAELGRMETRLRAELATTTAAGAPMFAVSAHTGAGIALLRDGIGAALRALPERLPNAPAYLPIDRVFALPGHGTIVTGTLMQGRIATGNTLRLVPPGRSVRVRSLQVFGSRRDAVMGGTRVAVNVPGVDTAELARGAVLAAPQFEPLDQLRVEFRPLPAALAVLRRRTPVRAYIGAAEILGTLVFERAPDTAASVAAMLHLRAPTIAVPGTPFVVRRMSPLELLGGGIIAGAAAAAQDAPTAQDAHEDAAILAALARAGLDGATPAHIGSTANLAEVRVTDRLAELVALGRARRLAKPPAYVAGDLAGDVIARAASRLAAHERERPWRLGVTSLALAQSLDVAEPALIRILAAYVETGDVAQRGGYYATPGFVPRLTAEQQSFFDRAFAVSRGEAPLPLAADDLRAHIKGAAMPELSAAFDTLCATGALVKVGQFVYRGTHFAALRGQLEDALRRQGRLTVSEFRTLTGISRKYAVPLLEFFDATGVTLRTGDVRVLRQTRPANPVS